MDYDILVVIVVVNAAVTLALLGKIARKTNRGPRLKRKAATALWRSDPIIPKHDPPKKVGGQFSSLVDDEDRQFFADFRDFANVLNWWFADEFTASRFRLQELPDGDLSLNVAIDHPTYGRAFAIHYNQTRIGRLEVRPGIDYTSAYPEVTTSFEIDWARFLGYEDLTEFLSTIAFHVTSGGDNRDHLNALRDIQSALTKVLWDNYRVSQYDSADDEHWGELAISFRGTAFFYVDRRDAPARPK